MRYLILWTVLAGCGSYSPGELEQCDAARSDDQVISDSFQLWTETYGMPEHSRCAYELDRLRVTYADDMSMCPESTDNGCMFYTDGEPRIYLRSAARSEALLAHELAHWLIGCSEQMGGGVDPDHTATDVWNEFVPAAS